MTQLFVPQQHPSSKCVMPGCVSDHSGEHPGQLSHWIDGLDVRTSMGALFVDLNVVEDGLPRIVLHDDDGHERRLSADEALSYGAAIIAAAHTARSGLVSR